VTLFIVSGAHGEYDGPARGTDHHKARLKSCPVSGPVTRSPSRPVVISCETLETDHQDHVTETGQAGV
jgi:hypothetical protein